MEYLLIIIALSLVGFIFLFYKRKHQSLIKKTRIFVPLITSLKEQKINPDVNTNNWNLHRQRLAKFGRSQYRGLTFFVSSQNKVFYLSEKGTKVYC